MWPVYTVDKAIETSGYYPMPPARLDEMRVTLTDRVGSWLTRHFGASSRSQRHHHLRPLHLTSI